MKKIKHKKKISLALLALAMLITTTTAFATWWAITNPDNNPQFNMGGGDMSEIITGQWLLVEGRGTWRDETNIAGNRFNTALFATEITNLVPTNATYSGVGSIISLPMLFTATQSLPVGYTETYTISITATNASATPTDVTSFFDFSFSGTTGDTNQLIMTDTTSPIEFAIAISMTVPTDPVERAAWIDDYQERISGQVVTLAISFTRNI
ncbi:MAG: hypothetical protein FWE03_06115 [Firmicutes bacterium]|nr:hypothetical protein [Bacillota bacterium]